MTLASAARVLRTLGKRVGYGVLCGVGGLPGGFLGLPGGGASGGLQGASSLHPALEVAASFRKNVRFLLVIVKNGIGYCAMRITQYDTYIRLP